MRRIKTILCMILSMTLMLGGCGSMGSNVRTNIMEGFSLKNTCYAVQVGDTISENPSDYVNADEDVLNALSFDFSQVDTSKEGMYYASVTNGSDRYSFVVNVVEDMSAYDALVMSETIGGESDSIVEISIYCPENSQLSISWNKVTNADGYEIWQSVNNGDFRQAQTLNGNGNTTTSFGWLSTTKPYAFKVRPYFRNGGNKDYGEFSSVVSQKATVDSNTNFVMPEEEEVVIPEPVKEDPVPATVPQTAPETPKNNVVEDTTPVATPTPTPTPTPVVTDKKEDTPTPTPTTPAVEQKPTQKVEDTPITTPTTPAPEKTEIKTETPAVTPTPTPAPTTTPTPAPAPVTESKPTTPSVTVESKVEDSSKATTKEEKNDTIELVVEKNGSNAVVLNWNKVYGISGYKVYLSINNGSFEQMMTISNANKTSTDLSYLAKKLYAFKVVGYEYVGKQRVEKVESNVCSVDFRPATAAQTDNNQSSKKEPATTPSVEKTTPAPTTTPTPAPIKEDTSSGTAKEDIKTPTNTTNENVETPASSINDETTTETVNNIVSLTNDMRKRLGVGNLTVSPTLTAIAQTRANDMVQYDYFSHYYNGVVELARLRDYYGYPNTKYIGENIGKMSNSENASGVIMDAWTASPGHYANMTDGKWNTIGVGVAQKSDGTLIMVQVFGQ